MNNPKIPKSCNFDPEDDSGKSHKEPIDFNEEFDMATNLMTNENMKKYHYQAHLSMLVRTMIRQEDKARTDRGEETMKLADMQKLILKKYATVEYKKKLYSEADNVKQGKMAMQTYLTAKIALEAQRVGHPWMRDEQLHSPQHHPERSTPRHREAGSERARLQDVSNFRRFGFLRGEPIYRKDAFKD